MPDYVIVKDGVAKIVTATIGVPLNLATAGVSGFGAAQVARLSDYEDITLTDTSAPDTGFTSPDATVVSATDNGDNTWTVVLSNSSDNGTPTPDRDRSYTITQQQLDEGKGIVLDPPVVAVDNSGAQPEWDGPTRGALILWPDDDVGVVTEEIRLAETVTGEDLPYTRQPGDESRQIDYVTILTNNAGSTESILVLQAQPVFNYVPMSFQSAQSTKVVWSLPSGITQSPDRVMFSRFIGKPDPADPAWSGTVMAMFGQAGRIGVQTGYSTERKMEAFASSSPFLLTREIAYTQNSVVDVLIRTTTNSARIMMRVDGGAWLGGGIWTNTPTDDLTAVRSIRLGGSNSSGGTDNGFTHDQLRSAIWVGSSFVLADNLDAFFKGDGSLEYPAVAVARLGTPLIDFYNGANHGSLGAPVITPTGAFS